MARRAFLDLRIVGHENVSARLQRFPDVMRGRIVGPALRAGAAIVADRARALAPRDSGRLAGGSWKLRAFTNRRTKERGIRVASPTRAELGIPADATGFYPTSLEFGWRTGAPRIRTVRRAGGRGRVAATDVRRKIAGRRFMRAALFGAQGQVLAAVAAEAMRRMERLDLARASAGTE